MSLFSEISAKIPILQLFAKRSSPDLQLSMSTCWNSEKHTDGYEMLVEIRELGFERVELSHGIRVSLVPGIMKAINEGIVKIPSLHNFCPLPSTVQHAAPNLFQPSSKRRNERDGWRLYSRQTIKFAAQVGASHVIMHSGSVDFRTRSTEAVLVASLRDQKTLTKKTRVLGPVITKSARLLGRVVEGYDDLIEFADSNGIVLCVENREGILELPLDSDFPLFFDSLQNEVQLAYWHDTGHAQIKHQLGLIDHESHLEKLADRLVGWHLHDVSASGKDHQIPGTGTVDFAMIRRYIRPEHTLVVELSSSLTKDEVRESKEYLLETFA